MPDFAAQYPESSDALDVADGLGYMARMSLYSHGGSSPKCPWCGKFRRLADFAGSPTSATAGGIHIDFGPKCRTCRKEAKP